MTLLKKSPDLRFGLIVLFVFIVGVGLMVAYSGWDEAQRALAKVGWGQFGLLLLLSLANYFLRAIRWHIFAGALGLGTGFVTNTTHFLAGFAFTITPARVGELVRLRWIKRATGVGMLQSSPMMLGDRAADLAGVALLLLAAAFLGLGGDGGVYWIVGLSFLIAFLAVNPRFLSKAVTSAWQILGRGARFFVGLRQAARRIDVFRKPQVILPALALSVCGWMAEAYAFYLLLGWLGADVGFWMAVGIFLFSMLGGGVSGLPGGLGGAEAAMIGLLTWQQVPIEAALPATIIIRVTTLWFAILVGTIVFPFAERSGRGA